MLLQKSNENDFLLNTNFILFTNQGYALQNSSLRQLHSDGGVVSIVCSSAGRLLLVYLSASTSKTDDNVVRVRSLMRSDRRLTLRTITSE